MILRRLPYGVEIFNRLSPPMADRWEQMPVMAQLALVWTSRTGLRRCTIELMTRNLGDDADTTGAVCGQLAGAYWGASGIPGPWISGLARQDLLESALSGMLGGSDAPRGVQIASD